MGNGGEGSLDKVTKGTGRAAGGGVAVSDTGKLEELLGGGGSDDTGTTGGRDKTSEDGAALAGDLGGNGVGVTKSSTPVTTTDGDDGELGEDDGGTDGGGHFLGALDTETNMAIGVTNDDESLEASALTGTGLLLNGHDLHDLVLKGGEEVVDDLVLLDGEREKVDLLDGANLTLAHETAKLGHGDPFLVVVLASTSATTTATAATTVSTASTSETAASAATIGRCRFSHCYLEARKRKKEEHLVQNEERRSEKQERSTGSTAKGGQ